MAASCKCARFGCTCPNHVMILDKYHRLGIVRSAMSIYGLSSQLGEMSIIPLFLAKYGLCQRCVTVKKG